MRLAYLYQVLARVNPVYAPRRRLATALKHARAIHAVARCLPDEATLEQQTQFRRWAAAWVLDECCPSRREILPGHKVERLGGCDVAALDALAAWLLTPPQVEPRYLLAWSILFPETAQLGRIPYCWTEKDADEYFVRVIGEWELIYDQRGIYWLQIDVPGGGDRLPTTEEEAAIIMVTDLPAEAIASVDSGRWEGECNGWQVVMHFERTHAVSGSYVQLASFGADRREDALSILRTLPDSWRCRINQHADLYGVNVYEGTVAEVLAALDAPPTPAYGATMY